MFSIVLQVLRAAQKIAEESAATSAQQVRDLEAHAEEISVGVQGMAHALDAADGADGANEGTQGYTTLEVRPATSCDLSARGQVFEVLGAVILIRHVMGRSTRFIYFGSNRERNIISRQMLPTTGQCTQRCTMGPYIFV